MIFAAVSAPHPGVQGKPHVAVAVWRHSSHLGPGHHRVSPVLAKPCGGHRVYCRLVFGGTRGASSDRSQAYDAAGNAVYSSGAPAVIWVLFICLASAGLYLTYVGWKPAPGGPEAVVSPAEDRSHAAGD
jgi:hypothetical protein